MSGYENSSERRRYPRRAASLRAGIKGSNDDWHWYDVLDVSAVGVALPREANVPADRDVAVQIERVGGGTARVARISQHAVCLDISEGDVAADLRDRRVQWQASDAPDQRRHRRVRPGTREGRAIVVPIVRDDNTSAHARLQDISAGGLSVSDVGFTRGERVEAGGVSGTVVRADGSSAGIAFQASVDVNSVKLRAEVVSEDR